MVATILVILSTFFLDWYPHIPTEIPKAHFGWLEVSFGYQSKVKMTLYMLCLEITHIK